MKIIAINAWMEPIPLKKPYTIAYNTISHAEIVFLEIKLANGITGIGSASPSADVVGETPGQTLANLRQDFLQQWIGSDIRLFNELLDKATLQFGGLPGTLAAIDLALHDAFCKYLGITVAGFYGQKITALPTSITIGIKDVASMVQEAKEYYNLGFRILKIKTGVNVEEDIERVSMLQEQFGGKIKLRVDANTGYTLADLKKFITGTAHLGPELIEQPLPPGGENSLAFLDESIRAILAADESLLGPAQALELCHPPRPYGIFNIKLMKCGGIRAARETGNIALHAGIDLFWGCNDESIASIAAALHAAYSCANTRYLDLDGSFDLCHDIVTGGFELKDGHLYLLEDPGLGIRKINSA